MGNGLDHVMEREREENCQQKRKATLFKLFSQYIVFDADQKDGCDMYLFQIDTGVMSGIVTCSS